MEKSKIGSAIQFYRESFHISQSRLARGLCSVATLSRIEAGKRDVDSFLLETLLERLGKTPNQFELILSDMDFLLYQYRKKIKDYIAEKNYTEAYTSLNLYEKMAASKCSVHTQFIVSCKAYLNDINNGDIKETINLLMEAISYTIPDFTANRISFYYLSYSELNIIVDMVEYMLTAGMFQMAEDILDQVVDYLDSKKSMEVSYQLYPRVAVLVSRLLIQNGKLEKAIAMCNKGLEKNKGSRKMDYVADLYNIKAQAMEKLSDAQLIKYDNTAIIKLYLQAYYVYNICDEQDKAALIHEHLKEAYHWEGID